MCCSSPFPLSAETVAAFLLVLSYLGIYQPDEEQTENGEDEQHDACVEIVTFHASVVSVLASMISGVATALT